MFSDITKLEDSHQSLRQLAHELGSCCDDEVCAVYTRLLCLTEHVFRDEQRLMEEHQFPARHCHLEQHARVLCAMHKAHPAVMVGNNALGRHVGAHLLTDWFELHNATMDAALVVWINCHLGALPYSWNESSFWSRTQVNEARPRTLVWRGPERRSQPRA